MYTHNRKLSIYYSFKEKINFQNTFSYIFFIKLFKFKAIHFLNCIFNIVAKLNRELLVKN